MTLPIDQLIRAPRKTVTLTVTAEGKLIVKAPRLMPMWFINRFIDEKQEWIERRIALIQKNPIKTKKEFLGGEQFLYLGTMYGLQIESGRRSIEVVDKLYVPNVPKSALKTALTLWYKAQAKKIIFERIDLFKKKTGLLPMGVSLSDARSKWGTCFHDNSMNFSWRLVMAPVSVIDYVVAHEFAHIKVKNHSRKFWDTVGSFYPLYRSERRWLKKNGALLDF